MASVTVHVYVPAVKLVAVWVVLPFDHKYVYGGVPPLGLAVAVPLLPPLQLISVVESVIVKAVAGCVIVTDTGFNEYGHPLASIIVVVYIVPNTEPVKPVAVKLELEVPLCPLLHT